MAFGAGVGFTVLHGSYPDQPFPEIAPEWQDRIDQAREDLLRRDRVRLPHTAPPPDWTGWRTEYSDRMHENFVRDGHPRTRELITAAFKGEDFEHARDVNALQRVPLRINKQLLSAVECFAVDVMKHKNGRTNKDQRCR